MEMAVLLVLLVIVGALYGIASARSRRKGAHRLDAQSQQTLQRALADPTIGPVLRGEVDFGDFVRSLKKPLRVEREGGGPWLASPIGSGDGGDFWPLFPAGTSLPASHETIFRDDPRRPRAPGTPFRWNLALSDPDAPERVEPLAEVEIACDRTVPLDSEPIRARLDLDVRGNLSISATDGLDESSIPASIRLTGTVPVAFA